LCQLRLRQQSFTLQLRQQRLLLFKLSFANCNCDTAPVRADFQAAADDAPSSTSTAAVQEDAAAPTAAATADYETTAALRLLLIKLLQLQLRM
jgi:hypothetical protein